ncbi:MAG: OmpA family protein [Rhodospirillaceae bacterium]|jgi:chemotaxis protein MotB
MAAPTNPPEEQDEEEWLLTYADAITSLMAFFVLLLTFSKFDIPSFEEVQKGISEAIGHRQNEPTPTELLKIEVEDAVATMQAEEVTKVTKDEKGIVIELDSSAFYRPGSADILPQARPLLKKVSDLLITPKFKNYNVEIEGHTDDAPISTPRYPSNWELSAGRATRVARYFVETKIDPLRLKATGFAETRPVFPNRDAKGNPLKENMAKNRRVIIRVFPMSLEKRDKIEQAEKLKLAPKLDLDLKAQFEERQKALRDKAKSLTGPKPPTAAPGQQPTQPKP